MPSFQFNNHSMETILLASSFLLVVSVLASRIGSKFGIPLLLLFLGVGMLAGSEGPGGIHFDNYGIAFAIGSICLAFIIFDGGLRTSWKEVKPVLPLGLSLSFVGTIVTGVATAIFVHYITGLSWPASSLLGAIVSSTDAAAVFSILRSRNLSLKGNLKQLLEFEAGSNDPVAVFLTISVLMYIGQGLSISSLFTFFAIQAGLGFAFGFGGGKTIKWIINNVGIEYEGLYSVLILGLVILLFSFTAYLGGSGFLAVYVAGVIIGNADILHKGSITKFVDGMAWIAQILVFLTLGLLVNPSQLMSVWKEGLILGLFMMLAARPLSILIAAPTKQLATNEKLFISWIGLRGAAPIILATLPWTLKLDSSEYVFNLVFFVVLISVLSQGISIPWIATHLKVTEEIKEDHHPTISADVLPSGFELIEINVKEDALAFKKRIVDLSLPAGVLFMTIERGENFVIPRGDTVLQQNDHISGLARPSNMDALNVLFGSDNLFSKKRSK